MCSNLVAAQRRRTALDAQVAGAHHRREVLRVATHNEAVGLKITARHLMAATIADDDGRVLGVFLLDAPSPLPYPTEEQR